VPADASDWYGNEAPGNLNNKDWGRNAEIAHDLGWGDLFIQPAYRYSTSTNRGYTSGSRAGIVNDFTARQWSGEARLASKNESRVKWVGGVYVYDEHLVNPAALTSLSINPANAAQVPTPDRHRSYTVAILDTTAYAAFGQLTIPVVDRFRLIAGLRYTSEKRTLGGQGYQIDYNILAPDIVYPIPSLAYPLGADNNSHHTDWRGGFEVDVAADSMLYVSAATGFKAGGLNPVNSNSSGPIQAVATFSPETLLEYTAGIKNRFLNNRLTLNASYFHWNYRDRQVGNGGAVGGGVVTSNLTGSAAALANPAVCFAPPVGIACNFVNIASGRQEIQGVDLDGALAISATDRLNWPVGWLKAKYANEALNAGTADAPGPVRFLSFKPVGMSPTLLLIDFKDMPKPIATPDVRAPGATVVRFGVRDLQPLLAALRELGRSPLANELAPGKNVQSVLVRDPDGAMVEFVKSAVLLSSAGGRESRAGLRLHAGDRQRPVADRRSAGQLAARLQHGGGNPINASQVTIVGHDTPRSLRSDRARCCERHKHQRSVPERWQLADARRQHTVGCAAACRGPPRRTAHFYLPAAAQRATHGLESELSRRCADRAGPESRDRIAKERGMRFLPQCATFSGCRPPRRTRNVRRPFRACRGQGCPPLRWQAARRTVQPLRSIGAAGPSARCCIAWCSGTCRPGWPRAGSAIRTACPSLRTSSASCAGS
jgi:hypothetical protein